MKQMSPLWLLKYLPNMPACHIAIYNDLRGPNNSLTQREASANLAVGEAFRTITRGSADMMIAGATGTRLHLMKTLHVSQQEELAPHGIPPAEASRPFDRDRTGMVLGEGAAALVLEELGQAQARGAQDLRRNRRHRIVVCRRSQVGRPTRQSAGECRQDGPDRGGHACRSRWGTFTPMA